MGNNVNDIESSYEEQTASMKKAHTDMIESQSATPRQFTQSEIAVKAKEIIRDTVKSEQARLNELINNLINSGQYIINERPEGMSFEDYKFVRAELKKRVHQMTHAGMPVHQSTTYGNRKKGIKGKTFVNEKS